MQQALVQQQCSMQQTLVQQQCFRVPEAQAQQQRQTATTRNTMNSQLGMPSASSCQQQQGPSTTREEAPACCISPPSAFPQQCYQTLSGESETPKLSWYHDVLDAIDAFTRKHLDREHPA